MRRRALAIVIVLAALCVKMAVPAGFMIGPDVRGFTVLICSDAGGHAARQIAIPIKDDPDGSSEKQQEKGICPFAGLATGALTGADPVLLALALTFIVALGFAATRSLKLQRPSYIRPPLRGPPALI